MPRKLRRKYLVEDKTDGVLRFYFRRKGQNKIRLPSHPGTPEFESAYYEALNGTMKVDRAGPKLSTKGSIRWLCEQYFQSAEYKQLDARTKRVRKGIIEHIWAEPLKPGASKLFEDIPISSFTPKHMRVLRDRKADLPEAANGRIKSLRAVFAWAAKKDVELASTNPARDVDYFKSGSEGFHSWTEEEIAKFEARHPVGTKARLALSLMLYTSQRRSDVVLFGRQHVSNGWLRFTQQKNRKKRPVSLEIPLHPVLLSIIEKSPCGDLTFLVTEFNRPFTANGFGNWFRKRCNEAGLPHCSAHGLRKASATRLADRGATEHQIMSITGHTTSKEVTRYTKAARQKVLARSAIELIDKQISED